MGTDSSGNLYFDVENIRITAVPETWAGVAGLRIQAYKGEGRSLYPGAEIPVGNKQVAYDFINAIYKALEACKI